MFLHVLEAETYTREQLMPKTERLDNRMLDNMMKRFENEEVDEVQIK